MKAEIPDGITPGEDPSRSRVLEGARQSDSSTASATWICVTTPSRVEETRISTATWIHQVTGIVWSDLQGTPVLAGRDTRSEGDAQGTP